MGKMNQEFYEACSVEEQEKYTNYMKEFENFKQVWEQEYKIMTDEQEMQIQQSLILCFEGKEEEIVLRKENLLYGNFGKSVPIKEKLEIVLDFFGQLWVELSERKKKMFKNEVELLPKVKIRKNKETAIGKTKNDSKKTTTYVPSYLKVDVKKAYMHQIREDIKRVNLLDGVNEDVYQTFEQAESEEFYNVEVRNTADRMSSEEFINMNWHEKKYRCNIVIGDIGGGKSVLIYRLTKSLLDDVLDKRKGGLVIFISAWNVNKGQCKASTNYFNLFCSGKLQDKKKYIVIVDGLDELIKRGIIKNYKKLLKQAKKYEAQVIINCRSHMAWEIKENTQGDITRIWKTMKLDTEMKESDINEYLDSTDVSKNIRDAFMQYPVFKKRIQIMAEEEIRERKEESESIFQNDYIFCRSMYDMLVAREKGKYEKQDEEFWNSAKRYMQKIAMGRHEFGKEKISFEYCVIDNEKLDDFGRIMKHPFMLGMVETETANVVKGFVYNQFEDFFVVEELKRVLLNEGNEKIIELLGLEVGFLDEGLKNMKKYGLKAIPADHKKRIMLKLKNILNEEVFEETVKDEIVDIFNILNEK